MTPIIVVSAAAVVGLIICNLAWSRYARGIRTRNRLLSIELRNLRAETEALPKVRAELHMLTIRVQDLTRSLFPGRPMPGTLLGCLDRVEESFEVHRKANRAVRRQLSRTVDRLRQSQKEIKRLQSALMSERVGDGRDMQTHLKAVVTERASLRARMESMKQSLDPGVIEDEGRLRKARQELEEMRLQLRSAYRAIADLETQLTLNAPQEFQAIDGAERTELVMTAGPTEFEIM